jgi:hypothetical protein
MNVAQNNLMASVVLGSLGVQSAMAIGQHVITATEPGVKLAKGLGNYMFVSNRRVGKASVGWVEPISFYVELSSGQTGIYA